MKRLLQLSLIAALLAFTVLAIPATNTSVAHAATVTQLHSAVVHPHRTAASCIDDTCDGANPYNVGCASGAYVAKSGSFSAYGGGYIELVFNQACHAGWGFIRFNNAITSGHVGDVSIFREKNHTYTSQLCDTGNGFVESGQHSCYSGMLGDDSTEQAQACGYYDDNLLICTAWF